MDFFNESMKFGDIFESQETIDELKDISDEIKKYVVIPDSEKVKEYAECVVFDEQRIQLFLKDYSDLLEEIIMPFGSGNVGSMNNRPFYSKPFVRNDYYGRLCIKY